METTIFTLNTTSMVDLSSRELEIIKLICDEFVSKEIAEKLLIRPKTVEVHRYNILKKIGAKNVADIVRYAIKNGLYQL